MRESGPPICRSEDDVELCVVDAYESDCDDASDRDGDGLIDSVETNPEIRSIAMQVHPGSSRRDSIALIPFAHDKYPGDYQWERRQEAGHGDRQPTVPRKSRQRDGRENE